MITYTVLIGETSLLEKVLLVVFGCACAYAGSKMITEAFEGKEESA